MQANKLVLATSYIAQLQHFTAICAIVSITVTITTAFYSHRMKHMSSRGLTCPAEKQLTLRLKWRSIIYPCFLSGLVQFFAFTLPFFISLLISSLWHGQWWGIFYIVSSFGMKVSDQVREGHCRVCTVWGRGAASSVCTGAIDTFQTLSFGCILLVVLIDCILPGAVDSCKPN